MKKILFVLLLTVAAMLLFSCTKVPVDNPEISETDVTTPNEAETTPEIETPVEPETPIEPDVPVEPETPDETETHVEPETPVEPEKEVILLPEADENTKYITIEFPEDFPEEPYVEPNLVSPEEFDWGEYVPFVRYEADRYNRQEFFESYAFLTKNTVSLESGNNLYNELNLKYSAEYDVPNHDILFGSGKNYIESPNFDIKDKLFKSRVIYVSEDASAIGRFSLILQSESENLIDADWDSKLELIKNGVTEYTENSPTVINYTSGIYNKYDNWKYQFIDKDLWVNEFADSIIAASDDSVIILDNSNEHNTYFLCSTDSGTVAYKLQINSRKFVREATTVNEIIFIEQIIDNRYLLLKCIRTYNKLDGYYSAHYLYDLQTQEMTLVGAFSENSVISPDKKYLAYTGPDAELEFSENGLVTMKDGFYVKNLDTGSITFFEYSNSRYFGTKLIVQGWVNEENLMKLIEK